MPTKGDKIPGTSPKQWSAGLSFESDKINI